MKTKKWIDYDILKTKVKDLIDLREFAGRYIDVKVTNGKSYKALCPFHNDNSNPSMRIYDRNFECFTCKQSGDVFAFLSHFEPDLRFREMVLKLARECGIQVEGEEFQTTTKAVSLNLSQAEYERFALRSKVMREMVSRGDTAGHDGLMLERMKLYVERLTNIYANIDCAEYREACLEVNREMVALYNKSLLGKKKEPVKS